MSVLSRVSYLLAAVSLAAVAVAWVILQTWMPFLWVLLGLAVVFAGVGIWLDRKIAMEFFSAKATRHGMSMGGVILIGLIALLAINTLGLRRSHTMDFSTGGIHSLADQSVKIVESLKEDLVVYFFYREGQENIENIRAVFTSLMRRYQDKSKFVRLEYVEMNSRPDLTAKFDVKDAAQVAWLEYQGRRARVTKVDEQEITSAMVKVIREKEKKVYFLTGQGQLGFEPREDGLSVNGLKQTLEGNRYSVLSFSMTEKLEVPSDADMVFVVGPQAPLQGAEVKALEAYLQRGGSLVLALAPNVKSGLDPLLEKVGIRLGTDWLARIISMGQGLAVDPANALGSVFSKEHAITKSFGDDMVVRFRLPTSIENAGSTPAGMTSTDLVRSAAATAGFASLKFDGPGKRGPFTLVRAVKGKWPGAEATAPEFNLVVSSDHQWLSDLLMQNPRNRDLAVNTASYLSKEENLIGIAPKQLGVTEIQMTSTGMAALVLGFALPLPILLLGYASFLWYRRRYA